MVYKDYKSRTILREEKLSYQNLIQIRPDLSNKINFNLTSDIFDAFKRYNVYYISRLAKSWAPEDTIYHIVYPPFNMKPFIVKEENLNARVLIKFDTTLNIDEVANEFKKIEGIKNVEFVYPIIEYSYPNDP